MDPAILQALLERIHNEILIVMLLQFFFLLGLLGHALMMRAQMRTSNSTTGDLDGTMKDVAKVLRKIDKRMESGGVLQ